MAGSRVTECDAINELAAVAERLGDPVLAEQATAHGRIPFPTEHPLYTEGLPLWSPDVRRTARRFRCLAGRRHESASQLHLPRAEPSPPRAASSGASGQRSLATGQKLPDRSRRTRRFESKPGRTGSDDGKYPHALANGCGTSAAGSLHNGPPRVSGDIEEKNRC